METAAELLERLRRLGVVLILRGDRIGFDAPSGTLSPALRERIAYHRRDLAGLLAAGHAEMPKIAENHFDDFRGIEPDSSQELRPPDAEMPKSPYPRAIGEQIEVPRTAHTPSTCHVMAHIDGDGGEFSAFRHHTPQKLPGQDVDRSENPSDGFRRFSAFSATSNRSRAAGNSEPPWVEWARNLPADRWETWRSIADDHLKFLPADMPEGKRLDQALELAWIDMTDLDEDLDDAVPAAERDRQIRSLAKVRIYRYHGAGDQLVFVLNEKGRRMAGAAVLPGRVSPEP